MVVVAQWQSSRLWSWLLRVRVPSITPLIHEDRGLFKLSPVNHPLQKALVVVYSVWKAEIFGF